MGFLSENARGDRHGREACRKGRLRERRNVCAVVAARRSRGLRAIKTVIAVEQLSAAMNVSERGRSTGRQSMGRFVVVVEEGQSMC